ncbi:MAG: SUMF1/EgtB/PvdO family nonheme iron enzyme [Candidatus Latescibacteria bacterium]|nr:SUMF1/EgtB/PvdO family nonheme iron enzyme [Candidatus Latescibacterota bacterium]
MVLPFSRYWLLVLLFALLILSNCSPSPQIEGKDGSVMLLIPAGKFPMGGKIEELGDHPHKEFPAYSAERPLHTVAASPFYMDKFEVTNARYNRFLEAVKAEGDGTWKHSDQKSDQSHAPTFVSQALRADDLPAVGMNWYSAYAYCNWAEKRLPSEAEWEYAARGHRYRVFPWGDEDPGGGGIWRTNFSPDVGKDADGFKQSAPPGSYPDGVSPFGIMDMSGNVEEWVNDWLDRGYYAKTQGAQDPPGPSTGTRKVIKGGSFVSQSYQIRIATRLYGPPVAANPQLGFRCAQDP